MSRFKNDVEYKTLSVKDLLEARDTYHYHLTNLRNVVATAIGYYRFHPDDEAAKNKDTRQFPGSFDKEKYLHDTIVTPNSYPSVLIFVKNWFTRQEMAKKIDQYIPPHLYLRDGRVIPTCVLRAKREEHAAPPLSKIRFPSRLFGGGFPVFIEQQGQKRIGTIGCLVSDGNRVFALTNRHIAGKKQDKIFTQVKNKHIEVGDSVDKSVGKIEFSKVYPGWPGYRAISNLDAGLVELKDLGSWTAQVFGIGIMGELIDLNVDTINLDLIGCPVVACGGASGIMKGEIQALFYRYKSIGGFDYIADFLIGPSEKDHTNQTHPGDSGAIWFYDEKKDAQRKEKSKGESGSFEKTTNQFRPLAIQWGGHVFFEGDGERTYRFALASNLATVCRFLDVEIIRDWDIGHTEYWGKLGHFAIAQVAVSILSGKLKTLMTKNLSRVTYPIEIGTDVQVPSFVNKPFVPLADVPDLIWKATSGQLKRHREKGNHYANIDLRGQGEFNNKYLKSLWLENKETLDPNIWTKFYETISSESNEARRGALPFRVWQIYDEMLKILEEKGEGYISKFVAMAGVLAHYISDACMPLHNTKYHHGYLDASDKQKKVHAYIDNNILSISKGCLLENAFNNITEIHRDPIEIKSGKEAASYVMDLLVFTYNKLNPQTIIDAYNESLALHWKARYAFMIERIGSGLVDCIQEGTYRLAELWQNAWNVGNGENINGNELVKISEQTLSRLYLDKENFLPCRLLDSLKINSQGRLIEK